MKLIIKSLLLALLLLGTFLGLLVLTAQGIQAHPIDNEPEKNLQVVVMTTKTPAVLRVLIVSEGQKPLTIRINDKQGVPIQEHLLALQPGKYRLNLNLSELEDGQYTVMVTNGDSRVSHRVMLSTATVRRPIQLMDN